MALKRKRSSPAFSSTSDSTWASDSSSPTSIPFFYTQSKPTESFYQKPTFFNHRSSRCDDRVVKVIKETRDRFDVRIASSPGIAYLSLGQMPRIRLSSASLDHQQQTHPAASNLLRPNSN